MKEYKVIKISNIWSMGKIADKVENILNKKVKEGWQFEQLEMIQGIALLIISKQKPGY